MKNYKLILSFSILVTTSAFAQSKEPDLSLAPGKSITLKAGSVDIDTTIYCKSGEELPLCSVKLVHGDSESGFFEIYIGENLVGRMTRKESFSATDMLATEVTRLKYLKLCR